MSKVFFTSDQHFNHANIIKYNNRPFANSDEMNNAMIDRWNEVVDDGDVVYQLGDFTLGTTRDAAHFISQLKGDIRFVHGSHDKWDLKKPLLYSRSLLTISHLGGLYAVRGVDELPIVLCHYAMLRWDRSHHGAFHLFGHSHGHLENPAPRSMDVGVDCTNFYPITFDEVLARIGNQEPSENHGRR